MSLYQAFKDMPTLLKFFTGHALVCFLFFLAAVIPGIPISFNGEVIESQELWSKGVGLRVAAMGLVMPLVGILILKRWKYCRQLYAATLLWALVTPYVFGQELGPIIFGVVISCAITGYLFINVQARAYFAS